MYPSITDLETERLKRKTALDIENMKRAMPDVMPPVTFKMTGGYLSGKTPQALISFGPVQFSIYGEIAQDYWERDLIVNIYGKQLFSKIQGLLNDEELSRKAYDHVVQSMKDVLKNEEKWGPEWRLRIDDPPDLSRRSPTDPRPLV